MLGAVIGDVVGSVYEFHNTRDCNFPMFSPSSNYTDDTVMTMAVADWAMKCKAAGENGLPASATGRVYGKSSQRLSLSDGWLRR